MTDYQKAIEQRCSRRTYLVKPLAQAAQLREKVAEYNERSGLRMRLIEDDPWLFSSFTSSYGMFSGVRHYFAVIGRKDDPYLNVNAGYWGERLVLDATLMGLGTCWVGGTYRKDGARNRLKLSEEEELVCVITVGETPAQKTLKERLVYRMAKRTTKPLDELYTSKCEIPGAFRRGMEAVRRAPSALNRQPFYFSYEDDDFVAAVVPDRLTHEGIDLGIALLHFEIGSNVLDRFKPAGDAYSLRM